jgi:DNA-binding beta-propeller fold protein YncE
LALKRVFTGKDVRMRKAAWLLSLLACAGLAAQTVPQATDLPSHPFFIKNTWYIGGSGNWDYLTMDPQAGRLYIAHGTTVQIVDVDSGTQVGEIPGFYEARQIALDDTGQYGFASDGGQGKVVVFDRQTLKKVAEIDTGANPRSLVYDAGTRLLFVVRANPPVEAPAPANHRRTGSREGSPAAAQAAPQSSPQASPQSSPQAAPQSSSQAQTESFITIVDTASNTVIGEIALPGLLGFAVGDTGSQIYVAVTDRNEVFRFDAQAVAQTVASMLDPAAPSGTASAATPASTPAKTTPMISLDWTSRIHPQSAADAHLTAFTLGPECADPTSLAMDNAHTRLFAACSNRKLVVVNAGTGEKVTTLPIGPGVQAVGYDNEHSLLFTANGGAEGSMTIIRQDVTDSYAVIQTLPTRQRAATLAVNPATGAVYLVTDYLGVDLDKPGGIGTLTQKPVQGSFQVLQVAN